AVRSSLQTGVPVTAEVERRPDVIVLMRSIPLIGDGRVTGGLVLLRDVTDLRRRDRLLLTKDATIREVHHRVKNNLQMITSLLRLQSRRLPGRESAVALLEAERRIRSIALVHEILSRDAAEQVEFNEIVHALVRVAEDAAFSDERKVRFSVTGDAGELPAEVATPLAVVLNELLMNAAEHAFVGRDSPEAEGHVDIALESDLHSLVVRVRDDGVGLPAGFTIENTDSLGLSIVWRLVTSQLSGAIEMRTEDGTIVELTVPLENH
ncbi:MAG: sensor histidine kinase, partial [Acidimicrobiia bacterium]